MRWSAMPEPARNPPRDAACSSARVTVVPSATTRPPPRRAVPIASTVAAIEAARRRGRRVVALGTTVTRALEHAARGGTLRPGPGLADQRIGPQTQLRRVDAIVSGTHEPGTSHYELLRAFASDAVLRPAAHELEAQGYLTHEFGDSVLIRAQRPVGRKCEVRRAARGLVLA